MDPYRVLNIPPGSSPEVIEQAFRVAAQRFHPQNGGTRDQFAQVVAAYKALRPQLAAPPNPTAAPPPAPPRLASGPSQRYVVAPRMHATPGTNKTSVTAIRAAAGTIAAIVAFVSGFLFAGAAITPLVVVVTSVSLVAAAVVGPILYMAAYTPVTRYLLIAAVAGLALWPLIFGLLVTVTAVAGIAFIFKRLRLI